MRLTGVINLIYGVAIVWLIDTVGQGLPVLQLAAIEFLALLIPVISGLVLIMTAPSIGERGS
jgi:hypothetical protein